MSLKYSLETLLALRDSPLVTKPDLPALDDKKFDKSFLGPPKHTFPSSQRKDDGRVRLRNDDKPQSKNPTTANNRQRQNLNGKELKKEKRPTKKDPEWMDDKDSSVSTPDEGLDEMQKYRLKMKDQERIAKGEPAVEPKKPEPPAASSPIITEQEKPETPKIEKRESHIETEEKSDVDSMFTSPSAFQLPAEKKPGRFTKFFASEPDTSTTATVLPATTTTAAAAPKITQIRKPVPIQSHFIGIGDPQTPSPSVSLANLPTIDTVSTPTIQPQPQPQPPVVNPVVNTVANSQVNPVVNPQLNQLNPVSPIIVTPQLPKSEEKVDVLKFFEKREQQQQPEDKQDFNRILEMLSRSQISGQQQSPQPQIQQQIHQQQMYPQQQRQQYRPHVPPQVYQQQLQQQLMQQYQHQLMQQQMMQHQEPNDASAKIMAMIQNSIAAKKSREEALREERYFAQQQHQMGYPIQPQLDPRMVNERMMMQDPRISPHLMDRVPPGMSPVMQQQQQPVMMERGVPVMSGMGIADRLPMHERMPGMLNRLPPGMENGMQGVDRTMQGQGGLGGYYNPQMTIQQQMYLQQQQQQGRYMERR